MWSVIATLSSGADCFKRLPSVTKISFNLYHFMPGLPVSLFVVLVVLSVLSIVHTFVIFYFFSLDVKLERSRVSIDLMYLTE